MREGIFTLQEGSFTATILDSGIKVFQALPILIEAPKKMTLETKSQTSTQRIKYILSSLFGTRIF